MGTVRMTAGMVKRIRFNLYSPGEKNVEKVKRYLDYKEKIAIIARSKYKGDPISGPVELNITFYLPIPPSWTKTKQRDMDGQLHTSRPDRDNLEKGVCDALNKIVWKDDGQVCMGTTIKRYSREPRIEIEVKEVS